MPDRGPKRRQERSDTLTGSTRQGLMDNLHRLGIDTTKVSQEGIDRMLRSTIMDSLRRAYTVPEDAQPYVNLYQDRTAVGGFVDLDNPDKININVLHAFAPDGNTNLVTSKAQREMTPADRVRATLLHEYGHSVYPEATENVVDTEAAAFNGLARSPADALLAEVAKRAGESYFEDRNAYKERTWSGVERYDEEGVPKPEMLEYEAGRLKEPIRHMAARSDGLFGIPPRTALGRWLNRVMGR